MRLVVLVVVAACGSGSPPPAAPVAAQSLIDAASLPTDEIEEDEGDHVLPVERPSRGRVVVTTSDACGLVIEPVWFGQGSETPVSTDTVDALATMLTCLAKDDGILLRLAIQAHADPSETDPDELSLRRARTVATMLTARKMPTLGPFTLEPYGALEPRDTTGTADGRAHNRRVDFLILERKTSGN